MMHIMLFHSIDADLAELWVCACGRVILIDVLHRWYDVRAPGDQHAAHTGVR